MLILVGGGTPLLPPVTEEVSLDLVETTTAGYSSGAVSSAPPNVPSAMFCGLSLFCCP